MKIGRRKGPFPLTMKDKSVILKYMLPPFLLSLEIQRMRRSGTKGPFSPSEMALRDMSPLHPHIKTYSMYCKTFICKNNTMSTLFCHVQELCLFHFFLINFGLQLLKEVCQGPTVLAKNNSCTYCGNL